MTLLIKNGRVVDPSHNLDDSLDLLIEGASIKKIGKDLTSQGTIIDATGWIVAPGFVDMHVHLREPGKEEAETIESGARAAAAGGFTGIACMPNTTPVHDKQDVTQFILEKGKSIQVEILPVAAITVGQQGEELTDFASLKRAGIVALSDDGKPVVDSLLMRRALELGKSLDIVVIDHCEDPYLFKGGAANEGEVADKLGIRGIPAQAEEIMVARNILLSQLTGARVHLAHLSTLGSMELVRRAKADGVPVTAEVTPHHFSLTEATVIEQGTNAKMNPPLRTEKDRDAVLAAIADGTVDAIASDHAPHHIDTKSVDFHKAAFGIVGLETSVSLGLDRLLNKDVIDLNRFIELYSLNAARILRITRGIHVGAEANLTLFDPNKNIQVDSRKFLSKSRNTPFHGWRLRGAVRATIVKGNLTWCG